MTNEPRVIRINQEPPLETLMEWFEQLENDKKELELLLRIKENDIKLLKKQITEAEKKAEVHRSTT
jgi:hypothetical protein